MPIISLEVSKHIPRNPPSPLQQQEEPASPATNSSNVCTQTSVWINDCSATAKPGGFRPPTPGPTAVAFLGCGGPTSHKVFTSLASHCIIQQWQLGNPAARPKLMDLLLPVMTNMVESIWEDAFGNQIAISMNRIIHAAAVLPFIPFTQHQSQRGSFQSPVWCLKQGQLERRQYGVLGKPNPSNPNWLLLPGGCYKDCQKQWKYKIQTACLFPCTHENHSSSIINALGLICQDFHKNEFKTKKTFSIFMINAGKSVGWEIRLHTVLLPSKSLLTILDYFKSKQGEKMSCLKHQ